MTRRHWRGTLALLALAALGVLAAGCGGGSPSAAVAQLTTTAADTTASAPDTGGGLSESSAGGGGSGPSASVAIHGNRDKLLAYAQCMREHGVPDFPDPDSSGDLHFTRRNPKGSPSFQAADKHCYSLLPARTAPSPAQQAKFRDQALKFAACMRKHGFPQFPDPTFSGGGMSIRLDKKSGMDPNSPRFQAAQRACGSYLPAKFGKGK